MKNTRAAHAARFILIITALLLPTLSLLPLGGLYLWEKGWLLWWAIGAAAVVSIVFVAQKFLFASPAVDAAVSADSPPSPSTSSASRGNPHWTATEQRAWRDVQAIAAKVNPDKLTDSKSLFDLGHHTVNVVARSMHPTKSDALWQFTMPEALAITERVSQRLGRFVEDTIPFGDRLTVSQVLTVYNWRSVADVAGKAYDIWRIVRLANPATAITNEARERLSRAMLAWGKDHVSRQLAETFVLEVGRAAIDLYGGRLRISRDDILENRIDSSVVAGSGRSFGNAPISVLVAGTALGRLPALTETLSSMRQNRADIIAAFVRGDATDVDVLNLTPIDLLPGFESGKPLTNLSARELDALARAAKFADIVVWAQNGVAPPDEFDARALRALAPRGIIAAPVVLPLVYVPGDGGEITGSARSALVAGLQAAYQGHVAAPVILPSDQNARDGLTALWSGLAAAENDARRVQFARALDDARNRRDWTGAARQAASAAGALAKSMLPSRTDK